MNLQPSNPLFWFLVLAGLGFFLYGITAISRVIKKMADGGLQKIMNKCSGNRFTGFFTGAAFTAVIQSSGGTTALTIGMVRAGVLTFLGAAPIIIGANVGTTVTAFIISIPIAEYLSICVFIGGLILLLTTRRKWQNFGDLFFAVGCIFFGLWIMAANLKQLSTLQGFNDVINFLMSNPWLGLLIGALLTAALQSSSAVIGVVQSIYTAGLAAAVGSSAMTMFGILPILFGANIGSTVTALLSSIGGSKEAKRVAIFHLIYNVFGALLFMGIIYIPPVHNWLLTSVEWELTPALQIAFSHLTFNVVTAIIFLAALKPVCKLCEKIIPGSDRHGPAIVIRELDSSLLSSFPAEGIALGKEQVISMFNYGKLMFDTIGQYLDSGKADDASFVHDIESSIDKIDRQMNEYLLTADKGELNQKDVENLTHVLRACKDVERIGDYGENLIDFFETAAERRQNIEDPQKALILKANKDAIEIIDKTIGCFKNDDKELALKIIAKRREFNKEIDASVNTFFDEISSGKDMKTSYIELVFVDIMNCYERVYSHCSNIAKLYGTDKTYDANFEIETKIENMNLRY